MHTYWQRQFYRPIKDRHVCDLWASGVYLWIPRVGKYACYAHLHFKEFFSDAIQTQCLANNLFSSLVDTNTQPGSYDHLSIQIIPKEFSITCFRPSLTHVIHSETNLRNLLVLHGFMWITLYLLLIRLKVWNTLH